jgi:hypothetical protein
VTNGCVFGAGTRVGLDGAHNSVKVESSSGDEPQTLLDNSVFFGQPLRLRIAGEKPPVRSLIIIVYIVILQWSVEYLFICVCWCAYI